MQSSNQAPPAPLRREPPDQTAGRTASAWRLGGNVGQTDAIVASALFVATVGWLLSLPRYLMGADESYFLYGAKRIAQGEVPYRDFFEFITPGSLYWLAAIYDLFGATILSAKAAMAVVHGLTVSLLFAICRRIGLGVPMSVALAVAGFAISFPAWPFASPHWISTFLAVLLVWLLLARRRRDAMWMALPGAVCGCMVLVQQQRAAGLVAVVPVILAADALARRRFGGNHAGFTSSLIAWAAGLAAVTIPFALYLVYAAGWQTVFFALVEFPLREYPAARSFSWARVNPLTSGLTAYTLPSVLRMLPLLLVVAAARTVALYVGRERFAEVLTAQMLVLVCVAAAASIVYYPDFIHVAFIAPLFVVLAADVAGAGAGRVASRLVPGLATGVGWLLVAVLLGWSLVNLRGLHDNLHRRYARRAETAFGAIDFATQQEIKAVRMVANLLEGSAGAAIFSYPTGASFYLTTGKKNATRYQFLVHGCHSEEQFAEVRHTLADGDVACVVIAPTLLRRAERARFMRQLTENGRFERLRMTGTGPHFALFCRPDLARKAGDATPKR